MILLETYCPPAERVPLYALLGGRAQSPEFQKDLHELSKQAAEAAVKQGRSAASACRWYVATIIPAR